MSRLGFALLVVVSLLFSLGLLMVFDTTSAEIIDRGSHVDPHGPFYKQCAFGLMGIALGVGTYRLKVSEMMRHSQVLFWVATALLVCVFMPGIGQTINGARRWIGAGGLTFQPSEFARLVIPIAYIGWIVKQEGPLDVRTFLRQLGVLALPCGLILLEPDTGTTVLLFGAAVVLFWLTHIPFSYWLMPLVAIGVVGGGVALQMPHVQARLRVYLHPESDLRGKGHQPHQAKIAVGSGGLTGRGLGESLQKMNYLPEARSDYIAAVYAEEMGFVGVLFLILLYMAFAFCGIAIAMRAPDRAQFLLASTFTFLLGIQAFINLGVVSALLSSKGMALPFFSQGGSSLAMNCAAVGVLLQIARRRR